MAMQQQWPQEMHVRAHAVAMAAVQAQFSPQGTSLALQDSLSAGQPGETRVTGMPAYLQAPGEGQGHGMVLHGFVVKASATGPGADISLADAGPSLMTSSQAGH